MISRQRYNPEAHEALNSAVNGVVNETHPIADVRETILRTQEFAGTTKGVAPGAVDAAKGVIKECLKHRLREAASDAIFAGRRNIGQSHIGRLESSLSDAQAFGWLEKEVDFQEFASLLRNFQVRSDAGSECRDVATASRLVKQLQQIVKPPNHPQPRLTEATLTTVLSSMLRMIQGNPEACEQLVKLGAVSIIARLFIGDEFGVAAPDPAHPETQMCLAHLLAEVALQHAEAARRNTLALQPRVSTIGRAPTAIARPGSMPGESQFAIETLRQGLQGSLERSEHAAVWAVITALQRLAHYESSCEQLLRAGFHPILLNARNLYSEQATDGRLPQAIPRPKPRPPAISKDVQFVGPTAVPSALVRKPVTTKERWLSDQQHAASMPELRLLTRRKSGMDFLAGSESPSKGNSPQRSKSLTRTGTKRLGRSLTRSGTLMMQPGTSALMDLYKKPGPEARFPSLSWLICEDGVDKESFYRVCDRSFMLLQLQKLLSTIEKVGGKSAAPIQQERTQPKQGIMGGRPPSRGRPPSQSASRGSRGTGSRGTNRSAKRAASPS